MLLGSTVLEVAIGLFFVYLLLSLLCSAVSEYVEVKLNNRAKFLQQGIRLLLNDTDGGGIDLAKALYNHGLIRPLYRIETVCRPTFRPAPSRWRCGIWQPARLGRGTALHRGRDNDLEKIRDVVAIAGPESRVAHRHAHADRRGQWGHREGAPEIEDWYDAMMDRVAGWYKRTTSKVLLALGLSSPR